MPIAAGFVLYLAKTCTSIYIDASRNMLFAIFIRSSSFTAWHYFDTFPSSLTTMTTATPTPQELQALLNGPAGAPPSGTVPDFVNPSSLLYGVIVTLILTLSVSTIALATRIYTKLRLIKSLDIEDCKCKFILLV